MDRFTVYHCERGEILKLDLARLQTAEVNFSKPTQRHRLFLRKSQDAHPSGDLERERREGGKNK